MLMSLNAQVVTGEKRRVACIDSAGVVVSMQVIDTDHFDATRALYADVRWLHDTESCNEGWRINDDGTYSAPPSQSQDPDVAP